MLYSRKKNRPEQLCKCNGTCILYAFQLLNVAVIFLTWNVQSNLPYCIRKEKKKKFLDLPEPQILLPPIWVLKVYMNRQMHVHPIC